MKLAAYERELIDLVQTVRHWWLYLLGRRFVVRTNHYALKFLLDQRLSTLPQHQWVSKLFGYDFFVEFRLGHLNVAAYALSHWDEADDRFTALSGPAFDLFIALRCELNDNTELHALRDSVVAEREPLGASWMVSSSMAPASSYRQCPQRFPPSSSSPTPPAMRASRKLYIGFTRAPCAKGTKWSHCSHLACCNPWRCPRRCGRISPSTSLRAYPASTARVSS